MTTMKIDDHEATKAELLAATDSGSSTDSDASAGEVTAVPEDKRCKYPSKYCGRARVRKTNGTFHRFCQYHRVKANTNQKRWTSVRRQQAAKEEQHRRRAEAFALMRQATMPAPVEVWTPELLPDPISLAHCPEPVGLRLEDLHILHVLFVGDAHDMPTTCHASTYKLPAITHCDIAL